MFFKFRTFINKFIHNYRFPGYVLLPSSPWTISLYTTLLKALNPKETLKRYLVLRKKINSPQVTIPKEQGFLVLRDPKLEGLTELISYCRKVFTQKNWEANDDFQGKSYLKQHRFTLDEKNDSVIWNFARQKHLLEIITNYLGYLPILSDAKLWYSPNTKIVENSSQMFHLDSESSSQVKIFIFIEDIGPRNGPLTLIPANKSSQIYKSLIEKRVMKNKNSRVSDSAMQNHMTNSDLVELTGPSGTLGLIDTDRCFHFGSRGEKPRLVCQLQYIGPFSNHQAAFGRSINTKIPNLPNHKYSDIDYYLLGCDHLTHHKTKNQPYT